CATKQTIGDTRCSTAAAGDFLGSAFVHLNGKNLCGTVKNDEEIFRLIKIEAMDDTKARPQRSGDEPCASCGADEREMIQVKRMNARARTLADDQVNAKILHGG